MAWLDITLSLLVHRCLELIVLRSGELIVRDDAVLVLILVTKDLLYEFVLIRLHLIGLFCLGPARGSDLLNLRGATLLRIEK